MRALAILALVLGVACSGGRPLVLVEVSLAESGLKPTTVEISVTPSGGSPVTRTFEWSNARNDVLSAGIFLPADVSGSVMVRAAGMDAGGAFEATGTASVEKGKATAPVPLALRRVASGPPPDGGAPLPDAGGPGVEGGVPDAPPSPDLAGPVDTAVPVDVAPAEPPTLTKCQVYEHAGPCTLTPTTAGVGVWDLRFSPDGKYLVSGGDDGKARIWKVTPDGLVDENRVLDTGARSSGVHMTFSADSTRMALGDGNGTIAIYEFPRGTMVAQLLGHPGGIGDVALSADGTRVVSVDWMNNVKLWDVATAKELKNFVLPGEHGTAVLSPAGQPGSLWIAVTFTQMNNSVLLADVAANPVTMVRFDAAPSPFALAFSPDGRSLAISTDDGAMTLWDVSNKQQPTRGPMLWPAGPVIVQAAFSADGRFVAGAASRGMFGTGELKVAAVQPPGLRSSNGTMSSAMSIDFSPDGRAVAAGSWRCGKITYCKD